MVHQSLNLRDLIEAGVLPMQTTRQYQGGLGRPKIDVEYMLEVICEKALWVERVIKGGQILLELKSALLIDPVIESLGKWRWVIKMTNEKVAFLSKDHYVFCDVWRLPESNETVIKLITCGRPRVNAPKA